MATKIAVIGAIRGNFQAVFQKFESLKTKNGITWAIIVGELFAAEQTETAEDELSLLLKGQIELPIPTYFTLGKRQFPDRVIQRLRDNDDELCTNLYFLGRRKTIKTSDGIRIAALGGALHNGDADDETVINEFTASYSEEDVKILQKSAANVDILITSDWPAGVTRQSKVHLTESDMPSSEQAIAQLCESTKPRYHFSSSDIFFEREPFAHPSDQLDEDPRITRFISVAPQGTATKQRWVYGFGLDPSAAQPDAVSVGASISPFLGTLNGATKRQAPEVQGSEGGFSRFATGDHFPGQHDRNRHGRKAKRARTMPPTPQECFFCLSNPNIASHLIASIGDNAYLTTAKGPLSTNGTFPGLECPCHMLIIPLEHSATLSSIADAESRKATVEEMYRYQRALQNMAAQVSKKDEGNESTLGAVTWEITRTNGIHVHWQFMPIPRDLITRGLVEAAFKVQAENEKYPAPTCKTIAMPTATDSEEPEGDYFRARIWSGNDEALRELTLSFDQSIRFDLQFGRRVMAQLLGLDRRVDWRDCGQTEAEETADVDKFKELFKAFDFASA